MATLAMEVSRASMKVAMVTVMAMTQGFARGRHVSWKEADWAAVARGDPHLRWSFSLPGNSSGFRALGRGQLMPGKLR
jgi:hypothetical protein